MPAGARSAPRDELRHIGVIRSPPVTLAQVPTPNPNAPLLPSILLRDHRCRFVRLAFCLFLFEV
jgi:hypothetical protein